MEDLSEREFGKWYVVEFAGFRYTTVPEGFQNAGAEFRAEMWLCECECGHESFIPRGNLLGGHSTQCRFCATNQRKIPGSAEERKKRHHIRERWKRHIIENCAEEWKDFKTFYEWFQTQKHTEKYFHRRDILAPHGPTNTYFSDTMESSAVTNERVIQQFILKGMSRKDAEIRCYSITKQRRTQIIWQSEGRCTMCGVLRDGPSNQYCKVCHTKATIQRRKSAGWSEEKIAAKPIFKVRRDGIPVKKTKKPPGICKFCDEPIINIKSRLRLCAAHTAEHNEEMRIQQRMKKSGWTREQVLAWPKGKHVKPTENQ